MAERIQLGGEYQTENDEGEEVTRYKYWVDVSSSLMNRLNAVAIEENISPGTALAEVFAGDRELDGYESDESDD